ncbi:MAG: hypothetical protein ACK5F7_11970, partial [Planctomycetaceae bacterium]
LQLAVVAGSRAPVSGTDWPSLGTSGPHVSSRSPRSCIDSRGQGRGRRQESMQERGERDET